MAKGGAFEWKVIKKVGKWLFGRDDAFTRTPGSGAKATTRKKGGKKTHDSYGDMACNIPDGKFFTDFFLSEYKKGYTTTGRINKGELLAACGSNKGTLCAVNKVFKKSKRKSARISVLDFIDSNMKKPLLMKWWDKAEDEKEKFGRKGIFFVFERDMKKSCVMFDFALFDSLESICGLWNGKSIIMKGGGYNLVIILLEDFFKWCDKRAIKQLTKEGERKMTQSIYDMLEPMEEAIEEAMELAEDFDEPESKSQRNKAGKEIRKLVLEIKKMVGPVRNTIQEIKNADKAEKKKKKAEKKKKKAAPKKKATKKEATKKKK